MENTVNNEVKATLIDLGKKAKTAERILMTAGTNAKNAALELIASALTENASYIIEKNKEDITAAKAGGMSESMVDRLSLDENRINGIADAVRKIITLDDPVGKVINGSKRPNGLMIEKVTVPLGVIAVIFEARPNVTADAAALCLKSGNAVILRGGKEAFHSNKAIVDTMRSAVEKAGLPADCIQLVENTTRESANELMKMNDYVDVLIPRGGSGLIKACVQNATVPVIETGTGNCHVYVDEYADLDMAAEIIYNAKVSRPSVCNACESLVIHRAVAKKVLPMIKAKLDTANVIIHADEEAAKIIENTVPATEDDFGREYLGYEISVKIVSSIDEAIEHISKYTTGHSECIVTENYSNSRNFTSCVDAAAVYVNASTRFTDGGEFGFGAEIGISTQKLHTRGPLGLPELTTVKYIINGNGQIR
ncbi:MAG: glutamate-5-semialdehyde dehydrogenase [Faecalibacterium sp.]|nr:glutamate-5-semialdehyde dehydrogenase [Ruminococcus sp.]MCM1392513.1 glutamate-5-semialdehyde dehydrogenase [Ruminococcus sp.]MCM1485060.1 glutamate-5-semialdehyde dehydrogenase [Faecalibacterium sp.]